MSSDKDPAKLVEAGFAPGAAGSLLCLRSAPYQRPLASGSFVENASDEVLLEVPSGLDGAAGWVTLALMRRGATGYHLVRHLLSGERYEARWRMVIPGHADALLLCEQSGRQGLYYGSCGFLGWGSFDAKHRGGLHGEIQHVQATACGRGASVSLGEVTNRGSRLLLTLVVEEFVREPSSSDEAPGVVCSKKQTAKLERFIVDYDLDAQGSYQRVSPLPPQVTQVLQRY